MLLDRRPSPAIILQHWGSCSPVACPGTENNTACYTYIAHSNETAEEDSGSVFEWPWKLCTTSGKDSHANIPSRGEKTQPAECPRILSWSKTADRTLQLHLSCGLDAVGS
ncbi:hypothetical protein FKM82_005424 [Ascaphus truei]